MNIFGNPCGFGNCRNWDCEHCPHYKPTLFGHRVPKWVFKMVYRFYGWTMTRK